MTDWEIVIGLEAHTQLSTASKIFSGAPTAFGAAPNTQASAVDIALPGVLPVLNRGAVERAIRFGLAVGATINRRSVFARKNYFYPDLPKGYQISQYEIPVVQGGGLDIVSPTRGPIRVSLTRAHLEEDAGKSLHEQFPDMTGIDLNRAGTPLLEIVSEPDLRSSDEAVAYAKALHDLVQRIGICDGNMQEGSFRCDANVSVRPVGETKLGTRCEIKNLNSFRFMQQAIDHEVRRQIELIEDGGSVVQETRLYDPDRNETRPMRSKEDAQDYRYFPDPDLPPLVIDKAWIAQIADTMPESRQDMTLRFMSQTVDAYMQALEAIRKNISALSDNPLFRVPLPSPDSVRVYGLPSRLSSALTSDVKKAAYFEAVVAAFPEDAELAANWVLGELTAALNQAELDTSNCPVSPEDLADLLAHLHDGKINGVSAKKLFGELWRSGSITPPPINASLNVTEAPDSLVAHATVGRVKVLIENLDLGQISDPSAIEQIVDDVLAANALIVAEYKSGKEKAFNSLVGKAMAATKGKANPAQVNAVLKAKLGG